MTDTLSPEARRENMRRIRAKDTKPELAVRRMLHAAGFRFRVNVKSLPGTPDVVLPRYRVAIFVHGCFWHRHPGCKHAYTPKTRVEFWQAKFDANVERDARKKQALEDLGWSVVEIWECEAKRYCE